MKVWNIVRINVNSTNIKGDVIRVVELQKIEKLYF